MKYPIQSHESHGDGKVSPVLVEHERIAAWHATFNAALTGRVTLLTASAVWSVQFAKQLADEVHGSID